VIAGREFRSRLFVGTGKYRSFEEMARCHEASGCEVVTVAVRRVNLTDRTKESLLDYVDRSKYFLLPNTAGCYSAEEAIRTARLGREVGLSNWVKLEVLGDEQTLWPDNEALLAATKTLVAEGFVVFPYTSDDPIVCRKLEDAGAAADLLGRRSARASVSAIPRTCASSSKRWRCRWSSTRAWAPRATRRSRWSWARPRC
jgi:thiazole synthase